MLQLKKYVILFFMMNVLLTFNMGALRGFSDNLIPQLIILMTLGFGIIPWFIWSIHINFQQLLIIFECAGFFAAFLLLMRLKKRI